MRKSFLWILAAASLVGACTPKKTVQQPKEFSQVVHFGFYNFENLFDTIDTKGVRDTEFTPRGSKNWNSAKYHEKLRHLARVISDIGTKTNPDGLAFFGTAEIENKSVLDDFVRQPAIASRHYQYVHYDSPDRRGIDVALLYQPKYVTLISSRTYKLTIPNPKEEGGEHPTRDILYAKLLLMGDTVHVLVNHWPSRRGGEAVTRPFREKAAAICRRVSDSIFAVSPRARIVIMGDLNDDPVSPSVKKVIGAKARPEQTGPHDFYNPWVKLYRNGEGTLAYRDAWSLFDQILLSGTWLTGRDGSFRFYRAHVFHPDYLRQSIGQYRGYPFRTFVGNQYLGGYSDHFPTYITVVR